jgi:RIO kinase 1
MRGSTDPGPDPMAQTEEELKEVVRNWLDAGLQEDSSKLETPVGGAASTPSATSLAQDDAVFMSSYIPRNLGEVYDPERDIDRINKGQGEDLIYAGITGLNTQANGKGKAAEAPASKEGQEAESVAERSRRPSVKSVRFEDEQEESEDGSEDSDDDESERKPRGFRHEDKEAKKVCTYDSLLGGRC